jgi:hypothetical protein
VVHTCPRCELRFTTDAELTDHLDTDHAVHAGPEPQRFLVVVRDDAVEPDELSDDIRRRAVEAPGSTFVVLVVAARPSDVHSAEVRLRRVLGRLRGEGVDVSGEGSASDPHEAVAHLLERESFDEVIHRI